MKLSRCPIKNHGSTYPTIARVFPWIAYSSVNIGGCDTGDKIDLGPHVFFRHVRTRVSEYWKNVKLRKTTIFLNFINRYNLLIKFFEKNERKIKFEKNTK